MYCIYMCYNVYIMCDHSLRTLQKQNYNFNLYNLNNNYTLNLPESWVRIVFNEL